MTSVEIAWLAGLIEGEGCITTHRQGDTLSVRLALAMTDEDIVRRCQEMADCGSVRHRPVPGHKDQWVWDVSARRDVARILLAIYPLMGERRKSKIGEVVEHLPFRNRVAQCGTPSGAQSHRRRGESPCPRCQEAWNSYCRDRRERLRAIQ